jgi:hypothetical protein
MQEISLNILDLAQNAISAGASLICITVDEQPGDDTLTVTIADNGCGMSPQALKTAADPFYTTRKTRKVGLGILFFKMAAIQTDGSFEMTFKEAEGTTVRGVFGLSHIDRMPLGDVRGTVLMLIACNPSLDFVYLRRIGCREFELDTRAMRAVLGDVPLGQKEVTEFIKNYIDDGEKELNGGAIYEKP